MGLCAPPPGGQSGPGLHHPGAGKKPACVPGGVDAGGVFLLDSVTALLANEMFPPDGPPDLCAGERVKADLD